MNRVTHSISEHEAPRDLVAQSKYRLVRVLGRGGMGTVFEGEHVRMQRRVAIKTINPGLVERPEALLRFETEMRAFAALDHANIARAFDAESFGSVHAIVMEYLDGQTLHDFLRSRGRLKPFEACRCIRQAFIGLQYAHEKGLVHRDMKPQNLFLTKNGGIVKILDFGLAKVLSENCQSHGMTDSRVAMGTYAYMAPEQALDAANADIRADIYSLGCTLYLLIAGKLPFQYESDVKLLLAHQNETPQPLDAVRPEVPRALADLVERMMAKDPAVRPQTPREAADALLPFARGDSAKAGAIPDSFVQSPAAGRNDNHLKLAGIAAAVVALGLVGWATGIFSFHKADRDAVAELAQGNKLASDHASVQTLPAPFTAEEFTKHVDYLDSDELTDRSPGSSGSEKAATYISKQFEKFELEMVEEDSWFQQFALPDANGTNAKNIVAMLPGQGDLSNEAVIVCTHYDHIREKSHLQPARKTTNDPRDDCASGVSALLLIAQAFAKQKSSLPASHRAVLFIAFDGNEAGWAGSKFYVTDPEWPLDKTSAVINLGAIGQLRASKFYANEAAENQVLAECVRDAANQRHLVAETRFGGLNRSDHIAFIEHQIPCMQLFARAGADKLGVNDDDRLNSAGAADIAWIAYQAARKTATYADHIQFEITDHTYNANVLMNAVQVLGIVPNVNAPAGHFPQILFVVPNSPAAQCEFLSGDEVTAINGLPFNCPEDGPDIYHQLTFEEGIRVSVLRHGEKTEIAVPGSVLQAMSGPKSTPLEDGMYDVEFRYQAAPDVQMVYLAGEFNGWKPKGQLMDGPDEHGVFTTHVTLKEGVYQYKFVIGGIHWKPDPQNMYRIGRDDNCIAWAGKRPK